MSCSFFIVLLHAHRVSPFVLCTSRLNLFAPRTRSLCLLRPSVHYLRTIVCFTGLSDCFVKPFCTLRPNLFCSAAKEGKSAVLDFDVSGGVTSALHMGALFDTHPSKSALGLLTFTRLSISLRIFILKILLFINLVHMAVRSSVSQTRLHSRTKSAKKRAKLFYIPSHARKLNNGKIKLFLHIIQ